MTSFSTMSLYALTVQAPTATVEAIVGDFLGNNKQQILSATGSRLEIFEVHRQQNVLNEIFSQDVFGIIRHIAKFRLAGGTKDMIAISTDSGRTVTYEYLRDERKLKTVHFETFGKSGIRRVVPGEYLAVDPKGRAIMLASVEKNKLVYILTRSGQTDIAISSPLEAHRPQTLVYYLLGLDVGYDNPVFAALELDYSQSESDSSGQAVENLEKELVYYELDLGLNHIVRKWTEPVDRTANMLFRVPGGPNAPSGVLVCGEDNISYRRMYNKTSDVQRLAIPRREGATEDPNRKRIIVSGTLYTMKGGDFFYLLQTDDGDLFKVTFDVSEGAVKSIKIKYFDTIPVTTSICILKTGFVYCASESGDRILYELKALGEDNGDAEYDSRQFPVESTESFDIPYFKPRGFLKNLVPAEIIPSMNPIMDMEVSNIAGEDAPQIYTVSGTGSRSTFRTTRNALSVLDLIESPLPQEATGIWTTKLTIDDIHDTLIVLCLLSRTLVLRIGEDVDEASNTGFIAETTTLGVQQFGEDSVIQIHPRGIRQIRDLNFPNEDAVATHGELTNWECPPHRTIVTYAANNRQVAIALSSGEVYYFEVDSDGSLAKAEEEIALEHTITCLAIPDVPEGSVRGAFLAIGCNDQTIRIFHTNEDSEGNILGNIGLQALDSSPHGYSQYLHIGLRSGIYIRSILDEHTGEIGNTRRRFLGPAPVRFARVKVTGESAVLAMTTRAWLSYTNPRTGALSTTPLHYRPFESAWNFEGRTFKGVICVSATELRIFTFGDIGSNTVQRSIPLRYTPRKLVGNHEQALYYVIESDGNTMNQGIQERLNPHTNGVEKEGHDETNGDGGDEPPSPADLGLPRLPGKWASCIQVVAPNEVEGNAEGVVQTIEIVDGLTAKEIEENVTQSAVSAALVSFESRNYEVFLAVGVVKNLSFAPATTYKSASVHVYKVSDNGRSLEFYHATEVHDMPLALSAFKGKLVVGVGKDLCLYDCGMKSLLRKAHAAKCTTSRIVGIKTQGSRLVVSDQNQSVTYVVHKELVHPTRLIPFADDSVARWTTCSDMLDYNTTVGGDKFGNLWIVRCSQKISEAADESNDGQHLIQEKNYLGGAPNRLDLVMHYFTNDIPVSIQKTALLAGGEKVVFWAGLQGTFGALIPFQSRRDFKMFQQLELTLRNDEKPISGRDHLAYRSYYTPVKSVLDGDLIERFLALSHDERASIVAQLPSGWSIESVEDAIWNMRVMYAF
ncbi:CPSF A subunit region-domain-containing protein [Dendryphion nanum]|uniref:CPSF A subunit region-domain-containing protein n=1 Tax=Dendryphion nanum TaxID=256645 RepID=A0A9P9E1K1_9PLEO|nr:CPSF A subunit region-domain-containing protein [Dendryphion nanum]